MKYSVLASLVALLCAAEASAQARIFRCGSTYTNDSAQAEAQGCKPMEGGNLTVVEGTRVHTPPTRPPSTPGAAAPSVAAPAQRIDGAEQRARDADARLILEAELRKAETRQAELLREYNHGEPEKLGPETRNYQKYLDRVAGLKASMARNEADLAGLRRELSRLTASK